ncbi:MAG TPA: ABC transporter permease [Ilumatobacteraceae bacterium]|nr:ABC transporter permease [Ilumatobacteraceae bacterium]
MARAIGLKLLLLIPVILLVSFLTFLMADLQPGDTAVAILGENARPEQIAAVNKELGLDKPIPQRFVDWGSKAIQGDLGRSLQSNQPVSEVLRQRLPVTIQLAVMAQLMALILAVPLGAWSAWRAGRRFDRATSTFSFGVIGLPPFVLGLLLIYAFALKLNWFPNSGWRNLTEDLWGNLHRAFLPALTLALAEMAVYMQLLRNDMAATLQEDFVLASRARGMPTRHILLREALRPSSFSLITLAAVNLGRLIGGTVIIENLFGLPGIGRAIIQAIPQKDFPVLQGAVLVLAVSYLLLNAVVDIMYFYIDPRLRRG